MGDLSCLCPLAIPDLGFSREGPADKIPPPLHWSHLALPLEDKQSLLCHPLLLLPPEGPESRESSAKIPS